MTGRTIDHYRVLEEIGRGGMGIVYKALDTNLERTVALKFLPPGAAGEHRDRFLQEARAAATLNHPGICTIHSIGVFESEQFIVMEYVEGQTLRDLIPQAGAPSDVRFAVSCTAGIADALKAAHAKGIIHRDIKPENILVTPEGRAKVMDFGLARLKGGLRLTKGPASVGTPGYIAPEQLQGLEADGRSDLFSLGVIFYELLTGTRPFRGEHEAALMYSTMHEDPDLNPVPPEYRSFLRRALEKNPDHRFRDAEEFINNLESPRQESPRPVHSVTPLREQQEQRRLSAIMFTDMVGYSAVAQKNEALSLELLEEHRRVLRPIFIRHQGREIETIGDAFLVEFDSALGAARCAIEIQSTLRDRNTAVPPERSIRLRIGLHLGDVVHLGNRVHGDGVNIAARVEPLADPGGICLTEDFARQIHNKLDARLLKLGKPDLKNIRSSQCLYRIILPWEKEPKAWIARARFFAKQITVRRLAAMISIAAIVVVGVSMLFLGEPGDTGLPRNRIAVVPLANISTDPGDEYFADGMTEELISELSTIRGLDVIARTSVMKYKGTTADVAEIGKTLGVGTLLEGSVRKATNKARITVQLVDVATQRHLWTEEYDRELKDVFAIQSNIARMVAQALKVQLVQGEMEQIEKSGTQDVDAHRLFLLGLFHLNKRTAADIVKAIRYFEDAIAIDQNYPHAYAALADCYTLVASAGYNILPVPEATTKAQQAVTKALELDETLAEAHTSLAYVRFRLDWNWAEAEAEFRRAIELKPGSSRSHEWYGLFLSIKGRNEEALAEMRRAHELDPLSSGVSTGVGRVLQLGRRYDEAAAQLRRTIAMDSTYADAHFILGMTLALQKKHREGIKELETALRLSGRRPVIYARLGVAYAEAGRSREAEAIFDDLVRMVQAGKLSSYYLAIVHIGRHEYEKAVDAFERAYEEHEGLLIYMNVEPMTDPVRNHNRFQALVRKIGLGG
jgi:TolB-like protein/class 3 adenylate cyclase/Flp pilus assembly protein TadD/predicted Ser/Thr protein kinase